MKNDKEHSCVLIVDDTKTTLESLSRLLTYKGYHVSEADSDDEAIKKIQELKTIPSYVLIDQVLNNDVEGGTKTAKRINEIMPDFFIVMYTADPEVPNEIKWQAMNAGAHRYIKKAGAEELLKDIDDFIVDMNELYELTKSFQEISLTRATMASALIGLNVGATIIDREYRIWYANNDLIELTGKTNLLGAPCWTKFYNHPIEQGPCFLCPVEYVIKNNIPQSQSCLSHFPSGKLEWVKIDTTPIIANSKDGSERVIGAKKVVQSLGPVVPQMNQKDRLRVIAQGIVRDGFGRARIYKEIGNNVLRGITAAAGPDSGSDKNHMETIEGYSIDIYKNNYFIKALNEKQGTIYQEWDSSYGQDTDSTLQFELKPPWIDLPIWKDNKLIGWLSVDIVGGIRHKIIDLDLNNLWVFSEEIRRALNEPQELSSFKQKLLNTVAETKNQVANAQDMDHALGSILNAINKIIPCWDVRIRILESDLLKNFRQLNLRRSSLRENIKVDDLNSRSAYTIRSGHPLYIKNFPSYQERIGRGETLPSGIDAPPGPSLAILPLQVDWKYFGTLHIEPINETNWDQPDLKMKITELSSLIAMLLRDIVINKEFAERKAAAERELTLTFGAIHGIKGPAQAVRDYLQIIPALHKKGELTPKIAVELAISAGLSLSRIERLSTRLLRMFRTKGGQVQPVNIKFLIQACIDESRNLNHKMNFHHEISDAAETIYVDPDEFRAVLEELINNSIRATDGSGLINISASTKDDFILFCVADNGPGVELDELESIFERWYFKFPGGTGLGLSYVKKVIDDLGGKISAGLCHPGLKITMHIPKEKKSNKFL